MITIQNTTFLSIKIIAEQQANIILDALDVSYKAAFGRKMTKRTRDKAFKSQFEEIFNYYIEA